MFELITRQELRLLLALAIGLLIGADRERRKAAGSHPGAAGLRTFALIAMIGGGVGLIAQPLLTAVAALTVAGMTLVGIARRPPETQDLTTDVAMFATFVLGLLAIEQPQTATATGVVVAALLAWRSPLHRLVRETLSEQELLDALTFGIASLVILPLLPNKAVDPFGVLNPYALWRMAVVLMALSSLGYVAQRVIGARLGLLVAGFAGGLVSSTATIAAMAGRSRAVPGIVGPAASAAVASMVASMSYMAVLLWVVRPTLLTDLAVPLLCGGLTILTYSIALALQGPQGDGTPQPRGKAFDISGTLIFVVLVASFTLLAKGLVVWMGQTGILVGAGLTGLVDAHAAGLSMAGLAASGVTTDHIAALGLLIGLVTNMLIKGPAAFALGGRAFGIRVFIGTLLLSGALIAGQVGWQLWHTGTLWGIDSHIS